jgi:hypothetical protein
MIVDSITVAAARPQAPSVPPERAELLQARPVEGTAGNLTTRLDVQQEKNQQHGDTESQDERAETFPQTYDAKGNAKEVAMDFYEKRAASESVDLFV